uniref:B30.2/SPRY domain-containing protein n=2 Tax=Meloidogyne TaxID=189290 RepID=A0A915LT60_MELJA
MVVIQEGADNLQGSADIKEKSKELEKVINVYEANLSPMINKLNPPLNKEYALSEDCLKATLKTLDPKPTNIQAVNPLNAEHDYFEVVFSRSTYASVGLAKPNFPKQEQFGHLKNSVCITSNGNLYMNGKKTENFVWPKFDKKTIGVGVKYRDNPINCMKKAWKIYFTYNGVKIGSSLQYENDDALIPSISLAGPQATFEANFGERPFMFKFEKK